MAYCVIDFETTGFSPESCDVIEYAAVRVENGMITETSTELCRPEYSLITPQITAITGITEPMVAYCETFSERLRDFLRFIGNDTIVAHNIPFDMGFLRRYAREAGIHINNPTFCTLTRARSLFPQLPTKKLEAVARHLGIDGSGYHRALADAVITAKILIIMNETAPLY